MEKIDVEARARHARELFKEGYNCSQSVFLAYADLYGLDPVVAATLVAPLGGGMGRLREVCGAVSAAFMSWPSDSAAKMALSSAGNFWDWVRAPTRPCRRSVPRLITSVARVPIMWSSRLVSLARNSTSPTRYSARVG